MTEFYRLFVKTYNVQKCSIFSKIRSVKKLLYTCNTPLGCWALGAHTVFGRGNIIIIVIRKYWGKFETSVRLLNHVPALSRMCPKDCHKIIYSLLYS